MNQKPNLTSKQVAVTNCAQGFFVLEIRQQKRVPIVALTFGLHFVLGLPQALIPNALLLLIFEVEYVDFAAVGVVED